MISELQQSLELRSRLDGVSSLIGNTLLDRYRLCAETGLGGIATVYCAPDAPLGPEVAVRLVPEAGCPGLTLHELTASGLPFMGEDPSPPSLMALVYGRPSPNLLPGLTTHVPKG